MTPEGVLLIIRVLLALVLYAFFGYGLYLVWRSLPRHSEADRNIPDTYAVEFHGEHAVQAHRLRAINLIGRAPDNNIILNDERVSAHHARISFTGGQWLLEDLGSRNGTFVNDHPLEGPLVIALDDRIQVGTAVLELTENAPMVEPTFTMDNQSGRERSTPESSREKP
jgi:hypothetical protein